MSKSASEKVSDFRRNRKKLLVKISGNKCNICGYNKAISALQFHHIYPEQKQYGLAQNGTCHNLDKDLSELKKCILVCANCHREIHQNFYSPKELQQMKIYKEEEVKLAIEDNHKKKFREKKYCINCGKQLSYGTIGLYCSKCIGLTIRIASVSPARAQLKELIRTKTFTQIGNDFGVSDNSIRKWCDAYNLPRKKQQINSYSNEQWEKI